MNRKFSWVFLSIFQFLFTESLNNSGKSYYFKTIGNNEFTVYNRIHFLNHNISDFDANPHTPQNIQNIRKETREPSKKVQSRKFFLDEEWNYEATQVNKTNLPVFIRKFYEQRLKEPNNTDTVRVLFNTQRNSTSRIIKFDLSTLGTHDNISDADMYFYWPLENTSSIYKTSVVLRLYQFETQFSNDLNESILVENPDVHKLFNVIYISKAQKGWQTFKIKKPIDNWINGEDNLGLLLTISSYDENKLISVFNDTNEGVFRTFAVLNIRRNETLSSSSTNHTSAFIPLKTLQINNGCSKRPWQLDFKQLQWDSFVLYPPTGFMPYQCSGRCHLEDGHEVNNHAKLKHFVNGVREKVCCVPTEYSSLPIMYLDRSGNVAMKNYDQMVVESCGCR